jgi:hypothetical protein
MTVTYRLTGHAEDTTTYNVSIVRAERVDPTFTGTVTKTLTDDMPSSIAFTQQNFMDKYTQNDGSTPITSIAITGSNPTIENSRSAAVAYTLGDDILYAAIPTLTFEATGAGHVQYLVYADAGVDTNLGHRHT